MVEKENAGSYKVQYEKGLETESVTVDRLLEERDSNEITYDAKQLQEIESKRKERQKE